MSSFTVTVHLAGKSFTYPAIGADSITVHLAALELFGVCGVSVKPA